MYILQARLGVIETRGVKSVYTLQCEAGERGMAAGKKAL